MPPQNPSKPDPFTSHQLFNLPLLYNRCCLQGRLRPIVNVCMPAEPPSPPSHTCWLHSDLVPLHPRAAPRRTDGTSVGLAQRRPWRQIALSSGGKWGRGVTGYGLWSSCLSRRGAAASGCQSWQMDTLKISLGRKMSISIPEMYFAWIQYDALRFVNGFELFLIQLRSLISFLCCIITHTQLNRWQQPLF